MLSLAQLSPSLLLLFIDNEIFAAYAASCLFLIFAWCFSEIWVRFAKDFEKFYFWDLQDICLRLANYFCEAWLRFPWFSWDRVEICLKCVQDMSENCIIYSKICLRCLEVVWKDMGWWKIARHVDYEKRNWPCDSGKLWFLSFLFEADKTENYGQDLVPDKCFLL